VEIGRKSAFENPLKHGLFAQWEEQFLLAHSLGSAGG
jgi:hypothetical protein